VIAILGGLGAALTWAISTLCSSRSSRMLEPITVVAWVMISGLVITGPIALAEGVPSNLTGSAGGWVLISGAGNVCGLIAVYRALRVGQVSLIAPLVSTEGAIAATIALLAGESVAPAVGAMLGVIAVGICISSLPAEEAQPGTRGVHLRSVGLAMLAACLFGVSLYATGRASSELPSAWVVLSARLIGTITLGVPLLLRGRLRLTRPAVPLLLGAGVCEVAGFFSYTWGAPHGIAVAAVLSSQFASVAALGGYLLFSERLSRTQMSGIATVIAGVAVLSLLRA
jgi:drug/metabolite transporter (DMT)-like permease